MLLEMLLKIVRGTLSRVVLLVDRLTRPTPMVRDAEKQARVDAECASLSLYQFVGCPFCVKVRRQIRRLGLKIELRDAQADPVRREELRVGGGEIQVPCLKIDDPSLPNGVRWLYESSDINAYLQHRFG